MYIKVRSIARSVIAEQRSRQLQGGQVGLVASTLQGGETIVLINIPKRDN